MSLAPLLSASPVIQVHAGAAIAALGLGAVQLVAPKGTLPHRAIGWTWVVLMALIAVSSFFIHTICSLGGFSWIHLLSILTLVMLPLGVWRARHHQVNAHRRTMTALFAGALVLAVVFTLLPGRIMSDGGAASIVAVRDLRRQRHLERRPAHLAGQHLLDLPEHVVAFGPQLHLVLLDRPELALGGPQDHDRRFRRQRRARLDPLLVVRAGARPHHLLAEVPEALHEHRRLAERRIGRVFVDELRQPWIAVERLVVRLEQARFRRLGRRLALRPVAADRRIAAALAHAEADRDRKGGADMAEPRIAALAPEIGGKRILADRPERLVHHLRGAVAAGIRRAHRLGIGQRHPAEIGFRRISTARPVDAGAGRVIGDAGDPRIERRWRRPLALGRPGGRRAKDRGDENPDELLHDAASLPWLRRPETRTPAAWFNAAGARYLVAGPSPRSWRAPARDRR
ncbi:MAG: DUF2306 domain-containing protein [Rhizobiales bacterium]|nr:DUF2306 domain-containing protein [Hyphomicrobiales bacterium]